MTVNAALPAWVRMIRPMAETDIDALRALDDRAHGRSWSLRTFLDELEQSDRVHLVAQVDDVIVGHAAGWIDGSSARVTNVAVSSEHAGQGHATALLLELIQQMLHGNRVANIQLEVRPANRRAQRMYSRFGFVPVGIERNFYDQRDAQGSTDALVMAVTDVCAEPWRQRLADLHASHDPVAQAHDAGASA